MTNPDKLEHLITNRGLHDLNPLLLGWEACEGGHTFGPFVRPYTLLHCVIRGKGSFHTGGVTYPVCAGEVFRILPGEVTTYRADDEDPWEYRWIAFDGELSQKFATLPPVFAVSEEAVRCFEMEEADNALEFRVAANLFRLYAVLFGPSSHNGHYVRRVRDYIKASYMQELRVESIAKHMNLDRHYLSRLFHQKMGQSIQEYLISVRMSEAQKCLLAGISVGDTAERCGYKDAFLFSKMFKKRFGVSPSNWKKQSEAEKNAAGDL